MNDTRKRILSNSLFRVGGYAIGAALFFAAIVLIARYLGTERFGQFSFILAVASVFQLVADMGVRNIVIRDIALDKAHFRQYLSTARTLLWLLSLLSLGGVVGLAYLLDLTADLRFSMYLAGLAVVITFYGLAYSAVLRAFEEMDWDIVGFVLHKVLFIAFIWLVSRTSLDLQGVFAAMVLANALQWVYYWAVVSRRHGRAKPSLKVAAAWALLREALPLGVAEILRRLTRHMDKLLLAALSTPVALGLFSAAYKFLEAMSPFTTNLTLPLFPVFSRYARISPGKLFGAYEQSLKFLYALGMPLAVLMFVLSERIVALFFGAAYRDAGAALTLIAPAVVLLLPTSVYGYVFTALGRQRLYMGCVAASLLVNLLLDLLLIPSYSFHGAAVATLAAEAVLFVAGLLALARLGSQLTGLSLLWRPLLAGIGMGVCCWLTRDLGLAAVASGIAGGLAVYAGLLLVFQTFTPQERSLLLDAMRLRLGHIGP
ncbi:MAG TPA: oligosaccharide flippase family protein [Alphaproteobacteria bacterium]|nr:oligosaccharide flippase family protein [Alphaproteobacteria bacterium]